MRVLLAALAALLVLAAPASAASPDIVISQVYGGGGNTGAQYKNDFIELYNRGPDPVPVTGWSVQYAAAGGTSAPITSLAKRTQPIMNNRVHRPRVMARSPSPKQGQVLATSRW